MSVAIFFICLLTLVLILIIAQRMFFKNDRAFANKPVNNMLVEAGQTFLPNNNEQKTSVLNENKVTNEDAWWVRLNTTDQWQLAVTLIEKALPVWEKYILSNEITYRDSLSTPLRKIDRQLLHAAMKELLVNGRFHLPGSDTKNINRCYFNFVGPVIAIQDGDWVPPYPVKKIFLSVYYMLRCIIEQNGHPGEENFLAISISQSLDCLNISKHQNSDEIANSLEHYKSKLYPQQH